MAHLRSLPLTSLRWQEALNRHDQTQLKQLIQARFAHQHNATVHHFLPRLFGPKRLGRIANRLRKDWR
jgi:hypothetical protein